MIYLGRRKNVELTDTYLFTLIWLLDKQTPTPSLKEGVVDTENSPKHCQIRPGVAATQSRHAYNTYRLLKKHNCTRCLAHPSKID